MSMRSPEVLCGRVQCLLQIYTNFNFVRRVRARKETRLHLACTRTPSPAQPSRVQSVRLGWDGSTAFFFDADAWSDVSFASVLSYLGIHASETWALGTVGTTRMKGFLSLL